MMHEAIRDAKIGCGVSCACQGSRGLFRCVDGVVRPRINYILDFAMQRTPVNLDLTKRDIGLFGCIEDARYFHRACHDII